MARSDFSFFHSFRVRWSEVDLQAIVFNGHYFTYFDVGFTEYWRVTELPSAIQQAKEGKEFFARKASIEYFASARFDDVIEIGVRCARLGNSSIQMIYEIYFAEQHLVSGEISYVYADTSIRKGVAIPVAWRETITSLEKMKPSE